MQRFVGEWLLRIEIDTLAGGNRCGRESRRDREGLEDAHNGVRGDDVVVVREQDEKRNRITNQTKEDASMSGRSLIGLHCVHGCCSAAPVFGQEPAPAPASAPAADADGGGAAGCLGEESGGAGALEDLGL